MNHKYFSKGINNKYSKHNLSHIDKPINYIIFK